MRLKTVSNRLLHEFTGSLNVVKKNFTQILEELFTGSWNVVIDNFR